MNKRRVITVFSLAIAVIAGVGIWKYATPVRNNVIILMLDTLRADHLGVYGYKRLTSSNIDCFARENVKFSYTVTAIPWTPPSVATMFTGLYAVTHEFIPPKTFKNTKKMGVKFNNQLTTLAEIFKANGYSTAAVSPNPWITEEFGFKQGFDTFISKSGAPANEIVKIGTAQIDELSKRSKPFFLYLHFMDPHNPYRPPGKYKKAFTGKVPGKEYAPRELRLINLYDGEILFLDTQLGRLFSYLKEKDYYDDLTIILVADHGEQFMEHGQQGHGYQLFNDEVHVPLIVKSPKAKGPKVVEVTTSTVDIFPTALDAAGIKMPPGIPGVSLFNDEMLKSRKGVFTEIKRDFVQRAFTSSDGLKFFKQINPDQFDVVFGVFDRRKDYTEASPILDEEVVARLSKELDKIYRNGLRGRMKGGKTTGEPLKDSTIEKLKALGYLQ